MTRLWHWLLVRLASWYDEPRQLAALETAKRRVNEADRIHHDAVMRAEAARAGARFTGRR